MVPKFLATPEAALKWARAHLDIEIDVDDPELREIYEDDQEQWAALYSQFANDAYAAGAVPVHRAIALANLKQLDWDCLGKHWSRYIESADVYGLVPRGARRSLEKVVVSAVVDPEDIDWEYGFASFMYYGPEQWEVSLLSDSDVIVTHVNGEPLDPPIEGSSGPAGESWYDECGPLEETTT